MSNQTGEGNGPDGARAVASEIEQQVVLPPGISADEAIRAVLCVLTRRLSGGEALHVLQQLPGELRPLFHACATHAEAGETFDREGFIARVTDHLGVLPEAAVAISRTVFTAIRAPLSDQEVDHVISQLPQDLDWLWR